MIATILAVLVILFMILPIFILYPISFSPTSYIVFPNEGFSTQWYEKLFSDPLWAQAVQNSIVIAIFTTILSLLLGTIAAVCMNRFSHKWKTVLGEYFRLPQTIPIIVTAISIYALLLKWQLNGTLPGLVIAHTVIALPFVVTTMNAGMEIINNNFEDAAVNLGANRFMAFFHVTLPMLKSSIQSAMLFAFLTSFYVNNAYGTLKKVLLCPIDNYQIMPINFVAKKWMAEGHQMDYELCKKQHEALQKAYRDNGVEVELMEPKEGLVYEVFARDFGICLKEGYVLGHFKEPCRQGETPEYEKKLAELDVPCIARCTSGCFEGGDFCFLDENTLLHGVIDRTDMAGFNSVKEQLDSLGYDVIPVPVARKYLHIDVCINIIAKNTVIICPDILPEGVVARFERRGFNMIKITPEEVMQYSANIQSLGNGKVISSTTNTKVNQIMRDLGLEVIEVDISEIVKGGGGIHCMTFPLVREAE